MANSKDPPASPMKQSRISTFFSQSPTSQAKTARRHSPVPDERPSKRQKTIQKPLFRQDSPQLDSDSELHGNQQHSVATERWRHRRSQSPESHPLQLSPAEQASRDNLRAVLSKKLVIENNVSRRRDLDIQQDFEPSDEDETDDEEQRSVASDGDSDSQFKALQEMFSQPSKSKLKGKAASGKKSVKPRGKTVEIGPSGKRYTPLELQVRQLKDKYEGVLLMFEVGYKYMFYDNDARIAAKELGIVCFVKRNFETASIPTHRGDIHLKKLLSQGHKVGIIAQTETAALKKVGENRNAPFTRELAHLYTATTFVDEMDSVDASGASAPLLMCVVEEPKGGMGVDEKVIVGMIVVCPNTGDVTWDEFEDGHMRTELETRMVHTKPAELLLSGQKLSKPTERMLGYFVTHANGDHKIRMERYKDPMTYSDAFEYVSAFYTRKTTSSKASESFKSGELMAAVTDFPKQVVIALAQCIRHLEAFDIADSLLATKFFSAFITTNHMLLNGNTLTNLEIYRNETDFTTRGSLMWILDRTTTKFGSRLLRSWVGRPLVNKLALQERTDTVEEIVASPSMKLVQLRSALRGLPDLAKGLSRIQYGKCTPKELSVLLPAFNKVAIIFPAMDNVSDVGFKSPILNDIIATLPRLREPVQELISMIVLKRAAEGDKTLMWSDSEKYPALAEADMGIQAVEMDLADELKSIRRVLKKPALQWSSSRGDEYLVEIPKAESSRVPATWHLISSTSRFRRYHSPVVKAKVQERAQFKEMLEAAANDAFKSFLNEISQNHYALLRDAVNKLAIADCLMSLALVAMKGDYVKPEFTDEVDTLEIIDGRHPGGEELKSEPFVPNSVTMGQGGQRSKIITGPNMGGKSSSVKMIALIAIMAQIGSYVPAKAVKLSMMDSILTRMGASDELARGRSTFMVEMSETSDILSQATSKSLVILDELGRGTSTFDGMAIAQAAMHHLVQVKKCKTLFITHYPLVATELERRFPQEVQNLHMGFREESRINGIREISFLYRLTEGLATESFGIECGRLAGIPEEVLQASAVQAAKMRRQVEERHRRNKTRKAALLLQRCLQAPCSDTLDNLRDAMDSLSTTQTNI
ncbi:DNA mismatch repair protein MSH3 [Stereum hirsutum FP-91666 SS1]|uniref:DNA mismatch repair protein MSH3 n=1 Tax=Stereum hirsutum (strain FP-91666) TaxID=721885 RepID=UPI000440A485|nr:DNA mismatch repair protein MSH3 [Stereum hirsutum FP-91666 SS1]EIM90301.1 DNA mismatch repair protein MSH3 [Stereum hirsutum FP-91666 SS1]